MDGNGRWAKNRFLPRTFGHKEGVKKAKEIILHVKDRGIPYVSLYTFSKENWKRSAEEVSFLMGLILNHLKNDFQFYVDHRIRIKHIGDREGLSSDILAAIDRVERESAGFDSLTVLLAFNYSGRYDILQAVRRILKEKWRDEGGTSAILNEELFSHYLLTSGYPDPDLMIRTSGEFRISNYFLYQAAYSEFYVLDKLWPEISGDDVDKAIDSFYGRERRFGGVKE